MPPNCGMVGSGREENCVKEPTFIRVLGICSGYANVRRDLLPVVPIVDPIVLQVLLMPLSHPNYL